MKMQRLIIILICFILSLQGCTFFDDTYMYETEYQLQVRKESPHGDQVNVTSLSELREAIRSAVAVGASSRRILFDPEYSGSPSEDLASACWQVRTEDALCAYCVENIAYELNQIVSHVEARMKITYSTQAIPVDKIIKMTYATSLNDSLEDAISSGNCRLAILISRTTLTAEDMSARLEEVYRSNPALAPCKPECSVSLFSGTGTQRLYELVLQTELSDEQFLKEKEEMDGIKLICDAESTELDRAFLAADYLSTRCNAFGEGNIYAALITGNANSEGIALAYVALARQLGLECKIVQGQKNRQDDYWNLIKIDSSYYHIDLFSDEKTAWFKNDEDFWGAYRWNVNDYPKCDASASLTRQKDVS